MEKVLDYIKKAEAYNSDPEFNAKHNVHFELARTAAALTVGDNAYHRKSIPHGLTTKEYDDMFRIPYAERLKIAAAMLVYEHTRLTTVGVTHYLKTRHDIWVVANMGIKKFEIRYNDRGYKVGDYVILVDAVTGDYGSRKQIQYILRETQFGLQDDYVILNF